MLQMIFLYPIILSLLVFTACGTDDPGEDRILQTAIDTAEVRVSSFYNRYSGQGQLESEKCTELVAKFSGEITFHFKKDMHYRKGDVIFTLSGKEIDRKRQELHTSRIIAHTNFDLAQKIYDRKKQLKPQQYIATKELDQAKHDFEIAAQEVAAADSVSAYFRDMTQFRAPYAGTLDNIAVNQGEYVFQDKVVARFLSASGLKLVGQYYGHGAELPRDSAINIILDDSLRTTGYLHYFEEAVDQTSGGHTFWIHVDSKTSGLQPGMFVKYELFYAPYEAQAVPDSALVEENNRRYVVTAENGHYRNVPVKTGRTWQHMVELRQGPPQSTKVITRGAFEMFHRALQQDMIQD